MGEIVGEMGGRLGKIVKVCIEGGMEGRLGILTESLREFFYGKNEQARGRREEDASVSPIISFSPYSFP